ncbi:MAG TPA: hypothetical protein VLH15_09495 [Dehalococcoidales bacterium]|nr:hypothetical protein [Dehalococcoidales bacterium]
MIWGQARVNQSSRGFTGQEGLHRRSLPTPAWQELYEASGARPPLTRPV